jgi:hypothetical protein
VIAVLAALALAPATSECRGLQQCVPVKGPWVVVPVAARVPRPQVQYELTCPRGYVVGGVDAELTDRAIDVTFLAASGSPVSPGVTTSRTIVFVASYAGSGVRAPTFRPHAGCVPASGGGRRTPTAVGLVPPGQPLDRHTKTVRIGGTRRITVSCDKGERLVTTNVARAFATAAPPSAALVSRLSARSSINGNKIVVDARGPTGSVVQVSAICGGGR